VQIYSNSLPPPTQPLVTENRLERAGYLYERAIDAYKREHPGNLNQDEKDTLASMQTHLGELYSRATIADQGGWLDRKMFYPATNQFPDMGPKTPPSFPGLAPSGTLMPDYVNSKLFLDQAKNTLGDSLSAANLNLLWDSCFTEFQLGNYDEAVKIQNKIRELYMAQAVQNKEAILMSYDNIGHIYMLTGNPGKAIHEFKNARRVDKDAFKSDGTYTSHLGTDIAQGFLSEGKYSDAEKVARKNLEALEKTDSGFYNRADEPIVFMENMKILGQALRKMGQTAEADKIELEILRANNVAAPVP
jgi:tetratricopeptide (TPR) repeat protein